MPLGVVFPQLDPAAEPNAVAEWALASEEAGYDYAVAFDHVFGADPDHAGVLRDPGERTRHEPLVLFAYISAVTSRLHLLTGVLVLPPRQGALAAKQAAELAVLSGGRLWLGLGVGSPRPPFDALGVDYHTRGRRMEEQVVLMRALWERPSVSFRGRFHRVSSAGLMPRPPGGAVPLWMGGGAPAVFSRIARHADGWLITPRLRGDPAALAGPLAQLHREVRRAGREPASIGVETRVQVAGRSVDEQVAAARAWKQAGATHLTLNTMGAGLSGAGPHIEAMAAFAEGCREAGVVP
ncbi:MAG: TIGR03619 family F420-dependent LLM class oxidoreductase [Chloroflexi bacterium]|nr:TIGR03619 family F420-dependent LLM class oxidoreductase [Chloroflexota bacterium]